MSGDRWLGHQRPGVGRAKRTAARSST